MALPPRRLPSVRAALAARRPALDTLYHGYNAVHVVSDPIWIVRRFERTDDREVVGFCAAALAFGRVQSVLQSIEGLLAVMGASPAAFVRAFEPERDSPALSHLVHRWTRGDDLSALLWVLRQMLDGHGSIEGFFAAGDEPAAETIQPGLESFSARALALDVSAVYGRRRPKPGVGYFFSKPSSGGACKRLNLYLRWMVRRDEVDLGVWQRVRPGRLVVPLDTHVIRVGRCLGLTTYRSPGWRMAVDITRSLRALDPEDPIKYDFSICHVGMMGACGFGTARGDANCPLKGACRPKRR
ncbi:MAG: TIGR02757 family protein [Vicinamibacterales bacterium]